MVTRSKPQWRTANKKHESHSTRHLFRFHTVYDDSSTYWATQRVFIALLSSSLTHFRCTTSSNGTQRPVSTLSSRLRPAAECVMVSTPLEVTISISFEQPWTSLDKRLDLVLVWVKPPWGLPQSPEWKPVWLIFNHQQKVINRKTVAENSAPCGYSSF